MLIICSGPDTWHARKKAKELIDAFRKKHDPQGLSTETLPSLDLKQLLNQLSAPSLFSPKRLIRCDGLLESLKIADVRALAKRLKDDADQTILLSVEEEPPSPKIISEFSECKFVHYEHPAMQGMKFSHWCTQRAQELGVEEKYAQEIARRTDGDAWLAEQELMKKAANPLSILGEIDSDEGSIFDLADRFLTERAGWRESIACAESDEVSTIFVSQARSALRVADHETSGIHPYVAKKLSQLRIPSSKKSFLKSLRALIGTRQSLSSSEESQTLL